MSDNYKLYNIFPPNIRERYVQLHSLADLYKKLNMDFLVDITRNVDDVVCHKIEGISDDDFMHNIIIQLELSRLGIMAPIASYGYNNSVWILNLPRYKWTLFDYLSSSEWMKLEEHVRTKNIRYIINIIFLKIYTLVKYNFKIDRLTSRDFIVSENVTEVYLNPMKVMNPSCENDDYFIIDIIIDTFQQSMSQIL